jgi:alpha-ribazole phosphatase
MHERVGGALDDLVAPAREQSIVVVTHATPIKSAVTWLLGADVETILKLRVDLASVTAFAPTGRGLVLTDYNWCPARGVGEPAREQIEALEGDAAR